MALLLPLFFLAFLKDTGSQHPLYPNPADFLWHCGLPFLSPGVSSGGRWWLSTGVVVGADFWEFICNSPVLRTPLRKGPFSAAGGVPLWPMPGSADSGLLCLHLLPLLELNDREENENHFPVIYGIGEHRHGGWDRYMGTSEPAASLYVGVCLFLCTLHVYRGSWLYLQDGSEKSKVTARMHGCCGCCPTAGTRCPVSAHAWG